MVVARERDSSANEDGDALEGDRLLVPLEIPTQSHVGENSCWVHTIATTENICFEQCNSTARRTLCPVLPTQPIRIVVGGKLLSFCHVTDRALAVSYRTRSRHKRTSCCLRCSLQYSCSATRLEIIHCSCKGARQTLHRTASALGAWRVWQCS